MGSFPHRIAFRASPAEPVDDDQQRPRRAARALPALLPIGDQLLARRRCGRRRPAGSGRGAGASRRRRSPAAPPVRSGRRWRRPCRGRCPDRRRSGPRSRRPSWRRHGPSHSCWAAHAVVGIDLSPVGLAEADDPADRTAIGVDRDADPAPHPSDRDHAELAIVASVVFDLDHRSPPATSGPHPRSRGRGRAMLAAFLAGSKSISTVNDMGAGGVFTVT